MDRWYNQGMRSKTQAMDESQVAARVVGQTIARHSDALPADLERAWKAWSAGVGDVDERGMALLRAAFEAGYAAGKKS